MRDRPDTLDSTTHRISTGYGEMYVTVTFNGDREPFEVFVNIGDSGTFIKNLTEATGKLCSVALRSGADPEDVVNVLMGIRGDRKQEDNGDTIHSIPDGIGIAIKRTIDGKEGEPVRENGPESLSGE